MSTRSDWYTTRGRSRRSAGAARGGLGETALSPDGSGNGSDNGATSPNDPAKGWEPRCGPLVYSAELTRPYERQPGDPIVRPLRIYALDPAATAREGRDATIAVPYEKLEPGPKGSVLEVVPSDGEAPLDLDGPAVAIGGGRPASPADIGFRNQMVYAVAMGVYSEFRTALGRDVGWGYRMRSGEARRLRIRVDRFEQRNAHYDGERGEIVFGKFQAVDQPEGALNLSRGVVHTALSHDIVTHELTHALLDGLRPHFMIASSADALAFHEALADLVALFRKFTFEGVVRSALAATRGRLDGDSALTAIARQFGQTTGRAGPLRSALRPGLSYRTASDDPHERCQVLVAAVWRAFATVFDRKVRRYILTATGGSGVLRDGELPAYLHELLANEASKIARQFLHMLIRAIDYCPPMDLEFGEFLRAMITADQALVPDDPWGYREALIEGFRALGIEPSGVDYLSEDVLLWCPPRSAPGPVDQLDFASLQFEGDPGRPVHSEKLRQQAAALWRHVTKPEHCAEFGLTRVAAPGESVDVPCIDSIRTTRRIGPNGQIVFDLVAEVTQRRIVRFGNTSMEFTGGATVILDPFGCVRYTIGKGVTNKNRLDRQYEFASSAIGREFWTTGGEMLRPLLSFYAKLDETVATESAGARL